VQNTTSYQLHQQTTGSKSRCKNPQIKKTCAPTRAVFDPVAQTSIALNEEQILDSIEI
jgi:hypothetical protein